MKNRKGMRTGSGNELMRVLAWTTVVYLIGALAIPDMVRPDEPDSMPALSCWRPITKTCLGADLPAWHPDNNQCGYYDGYGNRITL